ncbi:TolC family protein [bacterium]|nr:TolC family protein [bacterium]
MTIFRTALILLTAAWAAAATAAPPPSTTVTVRPGADQVLSLEDCLRLARDGNDRIQAERHRREELDGQMDQALSTGLPTLDAVGTWNRGRDPSFALDESFGGTGEPISTGDPTLDNLLNNFSFLPSPEDIPAQTFWRANLALNWTLNPTKILGAVGAAGQGIRRQELIMDQVRNEVERDVMAAYHGIVLAQEQVAAAEAELANQAEFLEIARLRFRQGQATTLDTLQAAVNVANTEPRVRQARQALLTAGAQLNAALGRDPEAPLSVLGEQRVEIEPLDRDAALALALRRPDVQQLEVMEDLLRQNRRAQKADSRPCFTMNGSYGYVGKSVADLNDTGHDFWSATVALNVPLWTGMLTHGLVKETEASIRRTSVERRGLVRRVRVEVLDLLDSLDVARRDLAAAELNLARAESLQDDAAMMYRLGQADYLTVLQAESGRAVARTNLIQARYDVLTLTASLKTAVGVSPATPLAALAGLVEGASE